MAALLEAAGRLDNVAASHCLPEASVGQVPTGWGVFRLSLYDLESSHWHGTPKVVAARMVHALATRCAVLSF